MKNKGYVKLKGGGAANRVHVYLWEMCKWRNSKKIQSAIGYSMQLRGKESAQKNKQLSFALVVPGS